LQVILDVWEREPSISTALLERVKIGTPHIAGYSLDGKVAGAHMLLQACAEFLGVSQSGKLLTSASIELSVSSSGVAGLREALLAVYNPSRDDANLRAWAGSGESLGQVFDRLRKNYPERREIATAVITNAEELDTPTRRLLAAAGFRFD
jgi:erythronate-4-phosphate dehydrogenase